MSFYRIFDWANNCSRLNNKLSKLFNASCVHYSNLTFGILHSYKLSRVSLVG